MAASAFAMLCRPRSASCTGADSPSAVTTRNFDPAGTQLLNLFGADICHCRGYRFGGVIDRASGKIAPKLRHVRIVRIQEGYRAIPRMTGESPATSSYFARATPAMPS